MRSGNIGIVSGRLRIVGNYGYGWPSTAVPLLTEPLNFIHTGYVDGTGTVKNLSGGYYYTSQAFSENNVFHLDFYASNINPTYPNVRYFGMAARCVAR